jgi:hypothetical protein
MIGINLSSNINAIQQRINRLPVYADKYIDSKRKRDCKQIIDIFSNGIKNNTLGLEPLTLNTVKNKTSQGDPKPKNPLYGQGELQKDRAFYNMLRIKRIKRGWKVVPSQALHYSKKIKLSDLLDIHEKGCMIKNGFGKGILIRIPPRPALNRSYNKFMNKYKKIDNIPEMKKAVNEYIRNGKDLLFHNIDNRMKFKEPRD